MNAIVIRCSFDAWNFCVAAMIGDLAMGTLLSRHFIGLAAVCHLIVALAFHSTHRPPQERHWVAAAEPSLAIPVDRSGPFKCCLKIGQ